MNRKTVFWFSFFTGPLILLSYIRGVNAVNDPLDYWGGVSSSMQQFIVPWMFVAAVGYLLMWYQFFFGWSEDEVATLQWPGREPDGKGTQRLLLLYAAFLIPSMLWIDATRMHLEGPSLLLDLESLLGLPVRLYRMPTVLSSVQSCSRFNVPFGMVSIGYLCFLGENTASNSQGLN